MTTITGYRFFDVDSAGVIRSRNGSLTWPAPNGDPGAWVKHAGRIEMCACGLHCSPTVLAALEYRQGSTLGRVDADPAVASDASKSVHRRMRVVAVYSREYLLGLAALASAMCLRNFEAKFPKDSRPRKAVLAIMKYIKTGDAKELNEAYSAARAAYSAADRAAYSAAYSAADSAARAADSAAYSAADSAARAADSAARAADSAAYSARANWRTDFNAAAVELLALPVDKIGSFVRGKLPREEE